MNLPRVSVAYSNKNLLPNIAAIDGGAGIVGTVETLGLIGAVKQVFNLDDAETQGITEDDEPFLYRHIKEFYAELAGNQQLWVMGTAETDTMAQVLDDQNDDGAKKLVKAAGGAIRLLAVCRKPDVDYDPGTGFTDSDVEAAVLKCQTFCQARLAELVPLRVLVEGRVTDEDSLDFYQPTTSEVGFAGVVLGGSQNDGSASVGTALGRAVKYGAEVKIGKVANGPLQITQVYIGTKLLKDVLNLDQLHGYGFISFMKHPNLSGFYFGIDRMASTDDFRLLAYGRVVDKAAVITQAVYVTDLEGEVKVSAEGRIAEEDLKHLEDRLTGAVNAQMGNQISGLVIYIDPTQDITPTSKLAVKERIQPLGYTSFIDVDLGLTAPVAS